MNMSETQRMLRSADRTVNTWKSIRKRDTQNPSLLQQVYRMDLKFFDYSKSDLQKYRKAAKARSEQEILLLRADKDEDKARITSQQAKAEVYWSRSDQQIKENGPVGCIALIPEEMLGSVRTDHAAEYERKLHHQRKMEEMEARKTKRYRDKLRTHFVKKAKQYIGRTYSELDCCGLVRQCVHDLPLFGFRLDTCNQGVMFDSLIDHQIEEKQLKPGDLIFYKGDYTDEFKEPKLHGIVHVEIFLGHLDPKWKSEQQRSVGSRSAGWRYEDEPESVSHGSKSSGVQVYRSFKNISSRWKPGSVECVYCSIEPWLSGCIELPADTKQRMLDMGFTRLSNGRRVEL